MTEEQRRWWFATHPEYSWSRTRARLLGKRLGNADFPESSNIALTNERLRRENFIQKQMDAGRSRALAEQKWALSQEHASHAKTMAWAMDTVSLIGAVRALATKTASSLAARRAGETGSKLPPKRIPERAKIEVIPKTGAKVEKEIEAELKRAGLDPQDYRLVRYKDKYVAQRDSTFDPYFRDGQGKPNYKRMGDELAPYDKNGDRVVLHHSDQRDRGPLIEVTTAEHKAILNRHPRSEINRRQHDTFRDSYWKRRAEPFSSR